MLDSREASIYDLAFYLYISRELHDPVRSVEPVQIHINVLQASNP